MKESSLIALDATSEQASRCPSLGNMRLSRAGHMIQMSAGNMVACGGTYPSGYRNSCEVFTREQGNWAEINAKLSSRSAWPPSVQLDENRIWIGRKLKDGRFESVGIGKCQNWKVSKTAWFGKCQSWKVSETTQIN